MSGLIPYILLASYFLPLSITLGEVGGKPVDVILSDLAWVLVPFFLLGGVPLTRRVITLWAFWLFFPLLALAGSIQAGGSLDPVWSVASFWMPTVHLFAGCMAYRLFGPQLWQKSGGVAAAIVVLIALSDIFLGGFPRGCGYEGRWGGCFFGFDLYGFPNSSTSFLALMGFSIVYGLMSHAPYKILLWAGLVALIFIVPMSLSRSSTLTFILMLMCSLVIWRPFLSSLVLLPALGAIVAAGLDRVGNLLLFRGLTERTQAALEHGDLSTGRFDLWEDGFHLVAEAPLLGYKFSYFSSFSEYGTAHQQYLEVLFKAGVVGFLLYFGSLLYVFWHFYVCSNFFVREGRRIARMCAAGFLLLILVNCIFQPFLSYRPMANLIFFLSGFILTAPREARVS